MQYNLKNKLFPHPAQKWLYVSIFGFALCFLSLGMHVFGADSQAGKPLPDKVLKQVFGFEMYYFKDNKVPAGLSLKLDSAKFFGNALIFELEKSKNTSVTINQQAVPADFTSPKNQGDISLETEVGNGMVGSLKNGKITGWLLTKDKTLIKVEAPDPIKESSVEDILRGFKHIDKPSAAKP